MTPPSERDTIVPVRAYLTDESFGYAHWRAAQFAAPDADVQKWGILTLYESREARDAALARAQERTDDDPRADRDAGTGTA